MPTDDAALTDALRLELRTPRPPRVVTQEVLDFDRGHLERLVRLKPGASADPGDLSRYVYDLRYRPIEREFFAYVLPLCLQTWRDELRGVSDGAVSEHLAPVFADRHVFDEILTASQTAAVSAFMRGAILAEIDDQRGLAYRGSAARPYRWVRAVATHGVLLPDIESLWVSWWTVETIGRAVAVFQFLSCLLYSAHENPVFAPWTRNEGGGAPDLWEFEGHLHEHRWLEPNVAFLRHTLGVPAVTNLARQASKMLEGEPEHRTAARILADIPARTGLLERRCAELPQLLATTQGAATLLEWSV
jgi:hypothetical protein